MDELKDVMIIAAVVLLVLAVVWRVGTLRGAVLGA